MRLLDRRGFAETSVAVALALAVLLVFAVQRYSDHAEQVATISRLDEKYSPKNIFGGKWSRIKPMETEDYIVTLEPAPIPTEKRVVVKLNGSNLSKKYIIRRSTGDTFFILKEPPSRSGWVPKF